MTATLMALTATLLAYRGALVVFERCHRSPFANPVLISILILAGGLKVTGIDYRTYFEGAQFVHFLLGPATVALAVPLYRQIRALRRSLPAIGTALVAGSLTAIVSVVTIARVLGASETTVLSLAPKSATTPIAMGVSAGIGGEPSLTAVLVIVTGIVGAITATWVLDFVGVKDAMARGLGVGVAAHGIGTARAIQLGEVKGAFSGLGMGLNGILTAVLVPILMALL